MAFAGEADGGASLGLATALFPFRDEVSGITETRLVESFLTRYAVLHHLFHVHREEPAGAGFGRTWKRDSKAPFS